MRDDKTVGVIGIGLMGTAIAERLLGHGYLVRCGAAPARRRNGLRGAAWSDNPLSDCDRVVISLFSSEVVEQVLGRMQGGLRGGNSSTRRRGSRGSAAMGRRLAARGVEYLDLADLRLERADAAGRGHGHGRRCACGLRVVCRLVARAGSEGVPRRRVRQRGEVKLVSNLVLGLNRGGPGRGIGLRRGDRNRAGDRPGGASRQHGLLARWTRRGERWSNGFQRAGQVVPAPEGRPTDAGAAGDAGLPLPLTETHRGLLERAESLGLGDLDNSAIIEVSSRSR